MMRRICSSSPSVQVIQCRLQDLVRSQVISLDDYMCVLMGMREPAELFFVIFQPPVEFAARRTYRKRCMKKNQYIWLGNDLPHGWHIGMFLRNVTACVTVFFETCDECGFPRTAWTNNANQ